MSAREQVASMQMGAENLTGIIPGAEAADIEKKIVEIASSRRKLRKLRTDVLENESLQQTFGVNLPGQFDALVDRIQMRSAGHDFQSKVEKQTWGRWAISKLKTTAYFPVKHWKLTLLALLVAGGYYMWPQIVSMAQGVWTTRGLAAAKEIGKVSEAVGGLEQAHTLKGIGSAASSVPEGLAAPIPSAAASAGFDMLDPSLPTMSN